MTSIVRLRADWVRAIEAIHAPSPDLGSWAAAVSDAMRPIFPTALGHGMYVCQHEAEFANMHILAATPGFVLPQQANETLGKLGPRAYGPYHYPPQPVMTNSEVEMCLDADVLEAVHAFKNHHQMPEVVGMIGNPLPGVVVSVAMFYPDQVTLRTHERQLLTRVLLHIEAAVRLRLRPESVKAELTSDGRLLHREEDAPPKEVLQAQVARVESARSRRERGSAEAVELWTALVAGKVSIVPQMDRGRYLVLDNPWTTARGPRALTPGETHVLSMASQGLSTKLVAYGLGVSPTMVSKRLGSAASKVGVASRAELIRLAAMLARDTRTELSDAALTSAERDVLDLLQRGLSNREIARRRSRSVRTIANQVASLLRKTGTSSRRALLAGPAARTGPADER